MHISRFIINFSWFKFCGTIEREEFLVFRLVSQF